MVSAVVPHWNRADLLESFLANLRSQRKPFREVIVVDNGSTDGSADLAEVCGARVIRLEENLGFAAAVNRGIAASSAEWVAILNNDVTLAEDWLERLHVQAERWNVSFATGKILQASDPKTLDGAFDAISRGACSYRCGFGAPDDEFWERPHPIKMAPMTAALFRRELFGELGDLDERMGSYLEDIDFGIRCALSGQGGLYEPTAVAYHQGSATFGRWSGRAVRWIARNQVVLAKKHFRDQPRWPLIAGQALWGLVALRHGCGWAYLRGKYEGLTLDLTPAPEWDSAPRPGWMKKLLDSSEGEILEMQRQYGFDRYWRTYFWLTQR